MAEHTHTCANDATLQPESVSQLPSKLSDYLMTRLEMAVHVV